MLSHDDPIEPRAPRGDDAPIGRGLFGRRDRTPEAPPGGRDGRAVPRSPLNR